MSVPQIQIRQQPALIGIQTEPGRQEIQQPQGTLEIRQVPSELHISSPLGHFEIDQERAWDALGLGGNLATMSKIYSMAPEMALRGLARVVEEGNRLAAIHLGGNPIADNASDWQQTFTEFDFYGPASIDNVDLRYIPGDHSMEVTPGRVDIHAELNPPIIDYQRGKVEIYLRQYPKLEIIPPQIDATV